MACEPMGEVLVHRSTVDHRHQRFELGGRSAGVDRKGGYGSQEALTNGEKERVGCGELTMREDDTEEGSRQPGNRVDGNGGQRGVGDELRQ